MEKITFNPTGADGEAVDFYVLEQTRIGGVNYILVTDEEDGDGEALILRDESKDGEEESVSQFFHILGSVEQQNGCTFINDPDLYEYTIYTSCYNTNKAVLYYRTYSNSQITAVKLMSEDLDSSELINYRLETEEQIAYIN